MEGRKWEELPMGCLVNVFGRVGVESLLVDVPFVCKSWYKATLNPFCWKELDFPDLLDLPMYNREPFVIRFKRRYRFYGKICMKNLVKCVVDRSAGCATRVDLPFDYTKEALTFVADKCPALKTLAIHSLESDECVLALPFVIGKFKNLELLYIEKECLFKDIVTEIGAHCENFVALICSVSGGLNPDIGEEEVMAIVSCLPKLKCLALMGVTIKRENLIKILKGCVELDHLVLDVPGFDEDDEELLELASHIPFFECSFGGNGYDSDLSYYSDCRDYDSDLSYYSD